MARKKINTKNYLILIGMVILVISACFATNNLYKVIKENQISKSPLATNEVLYEDLKNTTVEINADTFLVVSYVHDEEVHNNEKAIKKLMNKHNLIDNVMYLDITEYRTDKNFLKEINETLNLHDNLQIKKFPAVIYYKEGVPTYIDDSTDHVLNSGDFEQIIDMYNLAS